MYNDSVYVVANILAPDNLASYRVGDANHWS